VKLFNIRLFIGWNMEHDWNDISSFVPWTFDVMKYELMNNVHGYDIVLGVFSVDSLLLVWPTIVIIINVTC
jgi:hypothetical protein